jgi:hypothetical protein
MRDRRSTSTSPAGWAAAACCALGLLAAACGRGPGDVTAGGGTDAGTGAIVCSVEAPTACPDPPPHFADVTPVLAERCTVCHYGGVGGPWPLLEYHQVADWRDSVRAMLLDCTMPPPDSGVSMSDDERLAILTWIACGALPSR